MHRLVFDPDAEKVLVLDPDASLFLVLVVESAGAIGAMRGTFCTEATVQGVVEAGPTWIARLIVSPTFSGFVESEL